MDFVVIAVAETIGVLHEGHFMIIFVLIRNVS